MASNVVQIKVAARSTRTRGTQIVSVYPVRGAHDHRHRFGKLSTHQCAHQIACSYFLTLHPVAQLQQRKYSSPR